MDITAKPRQGYLFLELIKNPYGEKVGAIDLSEVHKRAPSKWKLVVAVAPERMVDGHLVSSDYQPGDAVYVPSECEPIIFGARTLGLEHESRVKAVLRAGTFTPVADETSGLTIKVLEELHAADVKQARPPIALAG